MRFGRGGEGGLGREVLGWDMVRHDGEHNVVFEECFQCAQDVGEAAGGAGDASEDGVAVAGDAGLGDWIQVASSHGVKRIWTVVGLLSPHSKRRRRFSSTS